MLELLEQQRIPIWSHERKNNDPIVFGGGAVLTANPEPFAPFLDVVLMGDGEEVLPKFIEIIQETKNEEKYFRLKELAKIPGIYIPSFYKPIYNSDGQLLSIKTIENDIPKSVSKQTWNGNLTHSQVITPDAVWPNIHMVEVVRSCPEMCRFCLASYLTLPFRYPSVTNELIPAIEKGLKVTKRLGLLGASVTQHPEFPDLIQWLNEDCLQEIRLSISSVRASTVNPELTKVLKKHGSKSITIALESGSERLRNVINKKLSTEEIFTAAKNAKEGGLKHLKLYGMVGIPTESEEDVEETADLLLKIKQKTPGLRLTLGVSTFIPKAQTPFQWNGVQTDAQKRLKILNKRLKPKGIELRAESYRLSLIQALISRSDRRLARVIALLRGTENSLGEWKKAYKTISEEENTSLTTLKSTLAPLPRWEEVIHENWQAEKVLPWTHLQGPVDESLLIKHQKRSIT